MASKRLIAGLDIGNGYLKGSVKTKGGNVDAVNIDMPSITAHVIAPKDVKISEADATAFFDDIFNELDVYYDSPVVNDKVRRYLGRRAQHSGLIMSEFNVLSNESKADQQNSYILSLGVIAGYALKEYWDDKHHLPDKKISVDVVAAFALPINEFINYREEYINNYTQGKHIVHICNFEQEIEVEITFIRVHVAPEGAAAQTALKSKDPSFIDAMIQDAREQTGMALEGINSSIVMDAKNIVGVDIGEGTVNFPVFNNGGKFNTDISTSYERGYGTVLSSAIDRLKVNPDKKHRYFYSSRKELTDYLKAGETALNKVRYGVTYQMVEEEVKSFCYEIMVKLKEIISRAGIVDIAYVYGGGASSIKKQLYEMITAEFSEGEPLFLYLDSRYSRFLNREGLFLLAMALSAKIDKENK